MSQGSTPELPSDTPTIGGPAPATAPPTRLAGYEIIEEIARGGMGIVYRARHVALGRVVALKVMVAGKDATAEMLGRFEQETRAAAKLDHPNLVSIFEAGHDGPTHWFTMPYIEGRPLSKVIHAGRPAPRVALEWTRKVALALAYAHAHGVIHRDVKPSNILIDAAGEPHLADFGLAKEVESGGVTLPGQILGTLNYASPEQLEGDLARVGPRSDVYSLGATLYEMLTSRPPFVGESPFDLVNKVLSQEPVRPRYCDPAVPGDAETICLRALEKDPERRYATAADMAADLRRSLEGEAIQARPSTTWELRWRWAARNRGAIVAAAAAVVVLLLAVGLLAWRAERHKKDAAGAVAEAERLEREASAEPERARRKQVLLHARESAVGALALDGANAAARAIKDRLSAQIGAIEREEAEEREATARKAAEEEVILAKADRVSAVLSRWKHLAGVFRELEQASDGGRPGAPLRQMEEFLKETPEDTASQATALAIAGWARRLAGDRGAAKDLWQRARTADADVPFAALLEALGLFSEYVEELPMPMVYSGALSVEFAPVPAETRERAALRKRIEELAAEAGKARVWGKEGADDFRAAIDSARRIQAGDLEGAEKGLGQALSSPDLAALTTELLFARAHVRYLRADFQGGLADELQAVSARPGWPKARFHEAELRMGIGMTLASRGEDPRKCYREAIDAYSRTAKLQPSMMSAFNNRGVAWQALGDAQATRGEDPREAYRDSIRDYDRALVLFPGYADSVANRGIAHLALGNALAARGEDPRDELRAAESDATAVIDADPSCWMPLNVRGGARRAIAEAESHRGADPRPMYRAAIEDLQTAVSRREKFPEAQANLGCALLGLGDAEAARGTDPTPVYRKAIEAFGREIDARPKVGLGYGNRGATLLRMAQIEEGRGGDPTERIAKAIADLGKAIDLCPGDGGLRMNRGIAWQFRAEREMARGGDPREAFGKAFEDLDEAVKRNPADAPGYCNRARAHSILAKWTSARGGDGREEYRRAIADYDEALRRDPVTPTIRANRAQALVDLAQVEPAADAEKTFREAIAECARGIDANRAYQGYYVARAVAWFGLGGLATAAGKDPSDAFGSAVEDLGRAIELNPSDANARNSRGGVLFNLAQHEEYAGKDPRPTLRKAMEDFDQSLRLNPAFVDALFNRGYARMELGKADAARGNDPHDSYRTALADDDRAIALNPAHWMAHANRAAVCEALGQWDEAEKSYLAVEKLVGVRTDVEEALARVRKAKGGGH